MSNRGSLWFAICAVLFLLCFTHTARCAAPAVAQMTVAGTLIQGVSQDALRRGGETLTLHLSGSAKFYTDKTTADIIAALSQSLNASPTSQWNAWKSHMLSTASIEVLPNRKSLRVAFGAAPQFNITLLEEVRVAVPQSLISVSVSGETTFVILPHDKISIAQLTDALAGQAFSVKVLGSPVPDFTDGDHVKLVSNRAGSDCSSAPDGQLLSYDPMGSSLTVFVTHGAEKMTLCYVPKSAEGLPGKPIFVAANGAISVGGPQSFVVSGSDGYTVSDVHVQLEISGALLTELDTVLLLRNGASRCEALPLDEENQVPVGFVSTSRVTASLEAPTSGDYSLCYLRTGAANFVTVDGRLRVAADQSRIGDVLVDYALALKHNYHFAKLDVVKGAALSMESHNINVSAFNWTDGDISGQGHITIRSGGEGSITGPAKALAVEIINHGVLTINVPSLYFAGTGKITNYGILTFIVNGATTPIVTSHQSTASLADWQKIVNTRLGKIFIKATSPDNVLRLEIPVYNQGTLVVLAGQLWLFTSTTTAEGIIIVHAPARLAAPVSFELLGRLEIDGPTSVGLIGKVQLTRARVNSTGTGSVIIHPSAEASFESIQVLGDCRFYVRGLTITGTLQIHGYNTFGPKTSLILSNVEIIAATVASIIANGHVICNVSSVRFGNNVMLSAYFQAVLFGNGSPETTHATLVPQYDPVNATLTIPPNASVILLDVGASDKPATKSGPHLCAQYLVIPIHVVFQGQVMLWGCATLPFGGFHSGQVTADSNVGSFINAYMQYALCQSTVLGTVEDDIAKQYLPGVCIPLFPDTKPVSGLLLEGSHEATPSSSDKPMIVADSLRVNGQFTASRRIILDLARELLINDNAAFTLVNGGRVRTPLGDVRGHMAASASWPIVFEGNLHLSGPLDVEFVLDHCAPAIVADGTITILGGASLSTSNGLSPQFGDSAVVLVGDSIEGSLPALEDTMPDGTRVTNGNKMSTLSFHRDQPSSRSVVLFTFTAVMASIGVLGIFVLVVGPRRFATEFLHHDIVPMHLSLPEFSAFTYNQLMLAAMGLEVFFMAAVAFHPSLEHPPGFDGITNLLKSLFGLQTFTLASKLTTGTLIATIWTWFFAWLPFFLSRWIAPVNAFIQSVEGSRAHVIHSLHQLNTCAAWVSLVFFVPIVSNLLDAPFCATLLAQKESCAIMQPLAGPSFVTLLLFVFLAPFSGTASHAAFCHWPYTRDIDLRTKRTVTYVRCCLFSILTAAWKITGHEIATVVPASALMLGLIFAMEYTSHPCVFANINLLKRILMLFPAGAIFAAQIQIWRARTKQICAPSDPAFAVLLLGAFLGSLFTALILMKRSGRQTREFNALMDPETARRKEALSLKWADIEAERLKLYKAPNRSQRDILSREVQKKRLAYLQELNKYRYQREGQVLKYYLGQVDAEFARAEIEPEEMISPSDTLDSVPMREALAKKSEAPVTDADIDGITAAQMATFNQGPVLGRGTYGVVYMSLLTGNKIVAVKIVPVSKKQKTESVAAVRREVDVLRTLRHPNIIQFYGCQATRKEIFIFMELANHGSLTQIARKFGRLSEANVRQYTVQMLAGLAYLHSRGIVHRDIKGENVLVDGNGVAKLGDFGCSKALAEAANQSQQGCASLVGSPYWMAPEVIRSEAYGTKADVWSLGCTVVEMLNGGQPPWNERFDNVYSAMFFIGNSTELPSNIPSNVSEPCRDFLGRCFERDPSKRASVNELLQCSWLANCSADDEPIGPATTATAVPMKRGWSEMFETDSEPSRPTTLSRQPTDSLVDGSMPISSQDGGENANPPEQPATKP